MSTPHRAPRRPAVLSALLAAAVGVGPLLVGLAAPAAAAPADIRINEIITNSATVADSIELTNLGSEPVDVSGWRVKDNDDTRTLAIAVGTTVPPGGFVTVQVDKVTNGFALGNGDAARLYLPDGTTLVDGHTFPTHSDPSWSRCPDGTGAFAQARSATLGAANDCPTAADLVINEVESDGDPVSDWVEIGNPTGAPVDASGLIVKDGDNTHAMPVPAGTTVAAGGFVAIYTEPAGDPAGFGLSGGDSARLFATDGTTLIDTYTWSGGHAATSYGRCPEFVGAFAVTAAPTRAAANQCVLPGGAGNVRINEIVTDSATVVDSIELTNLGATAVDLSGFIVKDNNNASSLALAAGTSIAPGAFLTVPVDVPGGFGLGNGDAARLFLPDGLSRVDGHTFPSHSNPSWSRCPDGTGAFVQAQAESLGAANACTVPDTAVRINEVESNGDSTDWVELYNTGDGAVDISGWIVRDNGSSPDEQATVPAGTSLAAGAYYAVDTDVVTGSTSFGLGAADQARLFADDGTTLIDLYEWTTHATTTYGRCPNGTGAFATTTSSTKNAANDCPTPAGADDVVINEVKTNPNPDFVELRNVSDALVDVSSLWIADSTHAPVRITTESTPLLPGELFAFDPDGDVVNGFGLNDSDSVTIYLSDATTVVDSYSWVGSGQHRTPSYGRCASATGLVKNLMASPGEENVCEPIRLNEIEASGGTPGDWVELTNVTDAAVDVSGWVFKDSKDEDVYAIPAGTTIAAGGYLVLDQAQFTFGLGDNDSARLFKTDGTTLVDTHAWGPHAATTYGRCPDGLGVFTTTQVPTKGTANDCPPPYGVDTVPWPGSQTITESDPLNAFVSDVSAGDVSGLAFDPSRPGVLWAVKNKNRLFKLTKVNGLWTPLTTDGWAGGKALLFANGAGEPDTEGITVGPDGAIYATSERDNVAGGVALNTVLRYDPAQAGPLTATRQWNLDADFPELDAISGGYNLGFEGLTWVPDSYLVGGGFVDQSTSAAYDPTDYPGHGDGLFLMALENDGALYAYALGEGVQHRVATVPSGFPHAMDVSFDPERQQVWAVCDDTCEGQVSQLELGATGAFEVVGGYERPTGMPNLNNEGFAVAPQATCTDGVKEVVWADDAGTGGHSLRSGTLPCTGLIANTGAPVVSGTPRAGGTLTVSDGLWSVADVTPTYQWRRDGVVIEGATAATHTVVAADKGTQLSATVTVSKTGYEDASTTSAPVTVEDLPLLVTAPVVTGSGKVGSPLTASTGAWDESGLTYAYQWLRSGTPIAGAISAAYTPVAADLGAPLTVRVTASRAGGVSSAPATTAATTVVAGDAATATTAPAVSGIPVTGQVLTGTPGTWSAQGLTFGYQWLRDGAAIAGATGATYSLVAADAGHAVTLRVTATRAGYADGTSTSSAVRATGPVASTTKLVLKRKVVEGRKAVATIRVSGAHDPDGKVVLTYRSGGRSVTVTERLSDGRARSDVPRRLKAGKWRVVATYGGDDLHRSSTSNAATLTVVAKKPKG